MKIHIFIILFIGAFAVNSVAQSNDDIANVQSKFVQQEALLKAQYEKQKYHMEVSGLKLIEHYSAKVQSNLDESIEGECYQNYKQYWLDLDYLISSFDTNEDKIQAITLQKFLTLRTAIQTLAKINLRHLRPCGDLYDTLSNEAQIIDDMLKAQWVDNVEALDKSFKNFSTTTSAITSLINLKTQLNDYKGQANFSYNSNQVYNDGSSDDDQFSFNIGLQLDKSIYPGEFNFNANLGLIVNGNQFEESITNINFSYDHDISSAANPLRREVFGFVSRSSNSFLDVEQRYEIGGGLIFNWFSKTTTKTGVKIDEKYKLIKEIDMVRNELKTCSESVSKLTPNLSAISDYEIDIIKGLYEQSHNMNRKRFAKWSGGLLLSLNVEFEEFITPDSVQVSRIDNAEEIKTIPTPFVFSHTSIPRLELRPFIEGNFNDKFIFKIKPYIFLPAKLWETEKSFTNYNGEEIKKYDIRYFVQSSITVRAHPVSVIISINYQHDSLPRNNITLDETGQFGTFYETNQTHLFTRIGFAYSFE